MGISLDIKNSCKFQKRISCQLILFYFFIEILLSSTAWGIILDLSISHNDINAHLLPHRKMQLIGPK